jgi:quinol monooxygenase YgiN
LAFHFIVRFQPHPGMETAFREELTRVVPLSRAEPGCLTIQAFESLREPAEFAIHSRWLDEAAFEQHVQMPHTVRFVQAAEKLLAHPIQGLRSREIA